MYFVLLQFEISVGNAGNTIDGQVQSQPPTRVGGSISGPSGGGGDTDSVQSAPLEDTGNDATFLIPNHIKIDILGTFLQGRHC